MSAELKSLCDRLECLAAYLDQSQHDKWCKRKDVPVSGYSGEGILVREAAAKLREMAGALECFVRHGIAAGAFSGDPDPIRFYTDTGYREVPVADFQNARAALGCSHG